MFPESVAGATASMACSCVSARERTQFSCNPAAGWASICHLATLDKRADSRIISLLIMHFKSPVVVRRRPVVAAVRAFTVFEILVVIAIIGMLVGLTVGNIGKFFGDAKLDLAGVFVKSSIKVPMQKYSMDLGDYPTTAEGLQSLIAAPSSRAERWRGPYLQENKIPEDPWKRPYQYRYPGVRNKSGYDVFSFGPDGVESEDDIGNW